MSLSRNAPCHCGSGKKYKKCCLGKEKTGENKTKNMHQNYLFFESDIDALTNETISLIERREFAKAEENCKRLMKDYPDNIDGHERYGDLFTATGEFEKAIESYEKVIQFMKTNPGFDRESIDWYKKKIEDLKDKL
ncbi:MAG: SEC-C metal-binding domain-containing protein [Cyclobacteriaceae bacterium]